MKFTSWLDAEHGRLAAVASHFRITKSAVVQWRTNGVPKSRILEVVEFTHGEVSIEEMVRDSPRAKISAVIPSISALPKPAEGQMSQQGVV